MLSTMNPVKAPPAAEPAPAVEALPAPAEACEPTYAGDRMALVVWLGCALLLASLLLADLLRAFVRLG